MTTAHDAYEKKCGTFTSQTTPSSNKTLCNAEKGPDYIIPIIFLPGIMGSNLKDDKGKEVWFPPNGILAGAGAAFYGGFFRTATKRQRELNSETTSVSNDGEINLGKNAIQGFGEEQARKRGWGTVYWDGYGEALVHLEKYLNHSLVIKYSLPTQESKENKSSNETKKDEQPFLGTEPWQILCGKKLLQTEDFIKAVWKPTKPFKFLTNEEFGKVADFHFPVFALGYNWLKSNGDSSVAVALQLAEIKKQVATEFPKATFKKFIIVTHSMGGLVARSLILDEAVKKDVLGIVHGVMPASGAPTVYKRFANGWDGKEVTGSFVDGIAKHVFGASSKKLTPVLANAPGGLELLPFANFYNAEKTKNQNPTGSIPNTKATTDSKQWLKLIAKNKNGDPIVAQLPNYGNPHAEIYSETRAWWRMVNKDFLDPAGILDKKLNSNKNESVKDSFNHEDGISYSDDEDGVSYSDGSLQTKSGVISFYIRNIEIVTNLHTKIQDSYHDNTYAHYANDKKHLAFNSVVWETTQKLDINTPDELIYYTGQSFSTDEKPFKDPISGETHIPEIKLYNWDKELFKEDGERRIRREHGEDIVFKLHVAPNAETGAGDGTVCHQSAADVDRDKVKQVFVIDGYDHANSYKNKEVLSSVLYSIGKMVSEYDPKKE